MEKSIKILSIIRKGAAIAASLLLFLGITVDVIFKMLGISSVIGHTVATVGIVVFAVLFALTIAICLIEDFKREKQKKAGEAGAQAEETKEPQNKTFIQKVYGFLEKHKSTIRIFYSILAFGLSLFFAIKMFLTRDYWVTYYFLMLFMWVLMCGAIIELFFSKDKNTLITHAVFMTATLAVLIAVTVFCHNMYYDPLANIEMKMLDFIIMGTLFGFALLYLIITSDNDIKKCKRTRNFGAGIILLAISIFMFFSSDVAKYMVTKWDMSATMGDKIHYLKLGMDILMYVILGIILLNMINVAFNSKHYVKTRNWLGMVDIAASFVSVVLCMIGILAFADYLALL